MIKPGQLCFIRKPQAPVSPDHPGHQFIGSVVEVTHLKSLDVENQHRIWAIAPELVRTATVEGRQHVFRITGCHERWLQPLENFDGELESEILDLTLQQTFQNQLLKNLGLKCNE